MNDMNENDFLEAMTSFKAMLTDEQLIQAEESQKEIGISRRVMLNILTKDAEEVFKMAEENRKATELMFNFVNEYISDLKHYIELSTACSTRLFSALSSCVDNDEEFAKISDGWQKAINNKH